RKRANKLQSFGAITVASAIGLGLSAFYLMPLLEWLMSGVGKDVPFLGFLNLPIANLVAFFFPIVFGPWFSAPWMPPVPGAFSGTIWAVQWDNLYAVGGSAILLLAVSAIWGTSWPNSDIRRTYFFFLAAGCILTLRYVNVAPAAIVNFLPVIGRQ